MLTDLRNYNMPFIRYDIGDVVERGKEPCSCGRNTDTLAAVHGRVRDVIATNGSHGKSLVTPLQADEIFRGVRGVAFYRFVQCTEDEYRISIMPEGASDATDTQMIVRRARQMLGDQSQLDMRFVRELKPERSMKFRFVYSEHAPAEV